MDYLTWCHNKINGGKAKSSEDLLIEMSEQDYPVGTFFYPVNKEALFNHIKYRFKVVKGHRHYYNKRVFVLARHESIRGGRPFYVACYHDGEWAEIV
jgi:hypothetical protein